MKKLMQFFAVVCMLVMSTQMAFAWENGSHKEDIYDGYRLIEMTNFAIGNCYFSPQDVEPTNEELLNMLYEEAIKANKKMDFTYTSYFDICKEINREEHIDIYRLGRRKALEIFKGQISKYVDGYIVCTVSNDTRLNIFYDVVDAKTHDVVYSYRKLAPKDSVRDEVLYREMTRDFYVALGERIIKLKKEKEEEDKAILKMGKEQYEAYKAKKAAEKKKEQQSYQSSFENFKENGPRLGQGHKVE